MSIQSSSEEVKKFSEKGFGVRKRELKAKVVLISGRHGLPSWASDYIKTFLADLRHARTAEDIKRIEAEIIHFETHGD